MSSRCLEEIQQTQSNIYSGRSEHSFPVFPSSYSIIQKNIDLQNVNRQLHNIPVSQSERNIGKQECKSKDRSIKSNISDGNFEGQNIVEKPTSKIFLEQYVRYFWSDQQVNPQQIYQHAENLQAAPQLIFSIEQQILSSKSFEKCNFSTKNLFIHSIRSTKYNEIVTLEIQFGWYKTYAVILNFPSNHENQDQSESPFHKCANIHASGAFGEVYPALISAEQIAVKCIKKKQSSKVTIQEKLKVYMQNLREWFFLKLLSELKIGPMIKKILGFDLIFGSNCMEFAMETCQELKYSSLNEEILKQSLKKMHRLNIVHRDIKLDNIMWSNTFEKPVFIDFGTCIFIHQKLGQRSETSFVGTAGYASHEMTQLIFENLYSETDYVDLYYNDMCCLIKSFSHMMSSGKDKQKDRQKDQNQQKARKKGKAGLKSVNLMQNLEWVLCKIKYKLYMSDFQTVHYDMAVYRRLCWEKDVSFGDERIVEFLLELKPNTKLKSVYLQLNEEVRTMEKFQKLKNVFKDELQMLFWTWTSFSFKRSRFTYEIEFYRELVNRYGHLSQIEQRIEKILISKQEALDYLDQMDQSDDSPLSAQQAVIYPLIGVVCSTLAHDQFGLDMDLKVKIANIFNKKANQLPKSPFPSLVFVCVLKQYEALAYLFQYFLTEVWHLVPEKYYDLSLKCLISSLCLLGYPFHLFKAKHFLLFYILKPWIKQGTYQVKDFHKRMQGITIFWKVMALFEVHNKIFYNRDDSDFSLPQTQLQYILSKSHSVQLQLILPHDDKSDLPMDKFLWMNFCLYKLYIKIENRNYKARQFRELLIKFKYSNQFGMKPKEFSSWKKNIFLLQNNLEPQNSEDHIKLSLFSNSLTKDQDNEAQQIEEGSFKHGNNMQMDFELHFTLFIMYCDRAGYPLRAQKMLGIVDDEIIVPAFRDRFFLQFRIFYAWLKNDIQTLKKLINMVRKELNENSTYNFQFVCRLLTITQQIMLHEIDNLQTVSFPKIIMLNYLEKLITKIFQYMQAKKSIRIQMPIQAPPEAWPIPTSNKITFLIRQKFNRNLQDIVEFFNQSSLARDYMEKIIIQFQFRRDAIILANQLIQSIRKLFELYHLESPLEENLLKYGIQKLKTRSLFFSKESYFNIHFSLNRIRFYFAMPLTSNVDCSRSSNQEVIDRSLRKIFENSSLYKKQKLTFIHEDCQDEMDKFAKDNTRVVLDNQIASMLMKQEAAKKQNESMRDIQQFEKAFNAYHTIKNNQKLFKFFFKNITSLKTLIEGHICCRKNYNQLFKFMLQATSLLKRCPQINAVRKFKVSVNDILLKKRKYIMRHNKIHQKSDDASFNSDQCQMVSTQQSIEFKEEFQNTENPKRFEVDWNPSLLVDYIHQEMKRVNPVQNPYFSLVIYSIVQNSQLTKNKLRNFIVWIFKSMDYLTLQVKQQFSLLHLLVFQLKKEELGQKLQRRYQQKQNKEERNAPVNELTLRKQFYFKIKALKLDKEKSINGLMKQIFMLNKLRNPKWKLPPDVQQSYRDKLYMYLSVARGFDEKSSQIQPYQQHIHQLLTP